MCSEAELNCLTKKACKSRDWQRLEFNLHDTFRAF